MLKRIGIYLNEMFPPIERVIVALLLFFEIYFVLLLNHDVKPSNINISEGVGVFTVFSFLLLLRIADDFKDYETDLKLFKERPLPSGRVKKEDLKVFLMILIPITIILNIAFMNNIWWFIFLYTYGFLMSMWFFQKSKIQKNLFLALITHNPIVMILNLYILSFTTIKYGLPVTIYTLLLAFTMYFPGLIWEISRKIRAPKEETEYVTYSSLVGYKKATWYVIILTIIDIITNFVLIIRINRVCALLLLLNVVWFIYIGIKYIKNPLNFKLVKKVERYTLISEGIMVIGVFLRLTVGYIWLF